METVETRRYGCKVSFWVLVTTWLLSKEMRNYKWNDTFYRETLGWNIFWDRSRTVFKRTTFGGNSLGWKYFSMKQFLDETVFGWNSFWILQFLYITVFGWKNILMKQLLKGYSVNGQSHGGREKKPHTLEPTSFHETKRKIIGSFKDSSK